MKRTMTRKRHRPEEIVAKLREVDEALSQGKTLEDVAKSLGGFLINDPAQGYSAASDSNFDAKVDGADLAMMLGNWGDAPRHDIPPSDCPLNLINP